MMLKQINEFIFICKSLTNPSKRKLSFIYLIMTLCRLAGGDALQKRTFETSKQLLNQPNNHQLTDLFIFLNFICIALIVTIN